MTGGRERALGMAASDIVEMNKRPHLGGGEGRLNVWVWVVQPPVACAIRAARLVWRGLRIDGADGWRDQRIYRIARLI